MTLFTRRCCLCLSVLIVVMSGCASSKSTIVRLDLTGREGETLNLMPFNTTFEREYYSDVDKRGNISLLGMAIAAAINERSGLYTYTFDDNDLENLRVSIIDSQEAANHFSAVNDVPLLDKDMADRGIRLYVDFDSMGVSQKVSFICEIHAHVRICNTSDEVLAEENIDVSEKGVMTLMAAKNAAIEKFIQEIATLLNSV